jgi:hypothetical protein
MEFTDEEIRNILRRHRKKQRREIFKWIGWFKKNYMRKTAPNNPPYEAQCGAPAFRYRGDVSDSSPFPRRVGAALENEFTGHKAMPARDTENMGRIDLPPSVNGADTPDGYQQSTRRTAWPGVTPANTLEVSRDGNPILQKEIGPNLEIKDTLSPSIKLRI